MKITIIVGPFLPVPPVLGGAVEKLMDELSAAMAARGHDITVVSRLYGDLPATEAAGGVKHVRVPSFDRPRSTVLALLCDLVYSVRTLRHLPDADIVITNSFMLPIVIRRRKYGALCISVGRMPKGQYRLYRHATRLIADSTALARKLKLEAPDIADRIRVIPRPLSSRYSELMSTAPPTTEREKIILYVGRVHPEKGIGLLIDAFARLSAEGGGDWRLVIVGPWEVGQGGGGQAYVSDLRRQSGDIQDRVEFAGPVFDQEKLFGYYARAEIFVYPSLAERGETFGVAALEAMATGCCTVVSRLDCFADFITDGQTGIVFDHNSDDAAGALSSCLQRVINGETLRNRLRSNGIERGLEFSVREIAGRYEKIFAEIADSSASGDG